MKVVTYDAGHGPRVGVLDGDRVRDAGFDGDRVAFIEAGAPVGGGGDPVPGFESLMPMPPAIIVMLLSWTCMPADCWPAIPTVEPVIVLLRIEST